MSEPLQLAALVEAILAVAGEPVGVDAIVTAAGDGTTRAEVEAALAELTERHGRPGSGLVVEAVGGGWRLATRPEHEAALRGFLGLRARTRLSQAALETLAIIAYRQPVTLPEVNFLRGVNSAGVLRTLLERKLVRVAGRKAVVGTPLLYRTSREFLVRFGLESLAGLPAVEQVVEETGEPASGA
jgi:segregation and condensation protein B